MLNVTPESIIFTVVNLLILMVALRLILFKPVKKIIAERQKEADRQFEESAKKQEEAEMLKDKYENSLAQTDKEKKKIIREARSEADEQYQKIIKEARAEAENIKVKAVAEAGAQKDMIIKSAEKEIADIVMGAATKMVGKQNGAQTDEALLDEFLDKAGE